MGERLEGNCVFFIFRFSVTVQCLEIAMEEQKRREAAESIELDTECTRSMRPIGGGKATRQ